MNHKSETLLLIVIVWNFNSSSVQGNEWSCRVVSPVTLQATFGATLSGHYTVLTSCTQTYCIWPWPGEKEESIPICAEVLSMPSMQTLICSGLGLQYGGYYWSADSHLSECYSMKYQQRIAKGRGAKLTCYTSSNEDNNLLNISNEESVTITFPLSTINKEQPQALDHTRLSFMMQVNRETGGGTQNTMTTICVEALLNISSSQDWDQIVAFFNTSTSHVNFGSDACNFTINQTISSQTVMEICAGNVPRDEAVTTEVTKGQEEWPKSRSHLVEELVLALVILVLLSLVIVLGSILVYPYCRTRCCGKFSSRNSTLLSNHYTDSTSQLTATDYMEMKMDPRTTAEGTNSHTMSSESSRHGGGTCKEAEAKYDELKNCSQRSSENGSNYSHLSYK